jgi:hypothetical protein
LLVAAQRLYHILIEASCLLVISFCTLRANDVRWEVEQFHRELKQLTGSEKCQCRQQRSQRNHLACCYHAWLSMKVKAHALHKTSYHVKSDLFTDYLRAELRSPRISAFQTD